MDNFSGSSIHRWKFFQIGGFDQVRLETANDLNSLDQLDEKLWAALSCPTWGIRFDKRTLDFIDTDGDGRIRVPEIKAAVRWACSVLRDPGKFFQQKSGLLLSSIKIVEHPISIRQAFWMPYKRIARMIEEQIEKFAAAREKATLDKASGGVSDASQTVETGKSSASQSFDVAKFAGIFAAIGLAIGALGTALAAILTGFLSLAWWQVPLAIVGIILVISVPSMIIAALKLRKRNLAPILDANGWAVNTLAKMNIPFGAALTLVAVLPKGAKRIKKDPFAEKKGPWKLYLFFVVLISVIVILYRNYELIENYILKIF